jgi:hypothetical protein
MWESGKFTIMTRDGGEIVDGIIHTKYSLGLYVDYNNRMAVTHLATGRRIYGTFSPKNFGDALQFVEEVGPIADWADPKPIISKDTCDEIARKHLPPEALRNVK